MSAASAGTNHRAAARARKTLKKRKHLCHQQHEQRPDGIGRAPKLLRHERAVDGGQQNQRHERAQPWLPPQAEQISDCQRGRKQQQQRPERQQAVAARVGIVVDQQRGERKEKRRCQQRKRRDLRPTPFAEPAAQDHQSSRNARQRPKKQWIAIDAEHVAGSRQAARGGIAHRPLDVVANARCPMQHDHS